MTYLPLTVLVVDDEQIARRRLLRLLRPMEDVVVVGEAHDVETAVAEARALRPDLMLLDVQMPGGDGFDVIDRLGGDTPLVVFVTAFDHHALRAFDIEAVDYVTKPVDFSRLSQAIGRVRAAAAERGRGEQVAELQATVEALRRSLRQQQNTSRSIWVRGRGGQQRIGVDSIDYIQAERDYVRLFAGGQSHLVPESMTGMEERLAAAGFLRIHRSTMVRRDVITQICHGRYGALTLRLVSGAELRVGRTYAAGLRAALAPRQEHGSADGD